MKFQNISATSLLLLKQEVKELKLNAMDLVCSLLKRFIFLTIRASTYYGRIRFKPVKINLVIKTSFLKLGNFELFQFFHVVARRMMDRIH